MNTRANHLIRLILLLILAGAFSAIPVAAQDEAAAAGDLPTALAPGDAIGLRFLQEPELSGEFSIDERGIAVLPLLGEYRVTGQAPESLRRKILDRYYHELTNQEVQVTPLRRIPVLGAVKNPGLYHIDATVKVTDALALAGGQTPDGKHNRVILLRESREISVALDKQLPQWGSLRSGDQLFVPQRSWFYRNSLFLVTGAISASAIIYAATL